MKVSPVFKEVGTILRYVSFIFLLPVLISLIYRETDNIIPFVILFVLTFFISFVMIKLPQRDNKKMKLRQSLVTIVVLWITVTLLGSIPFMWIVGMSFIDAFFESISSWTTTGFTLLNPETLSHTILFWRSLGQWLGGLGIVVLALNGLLKVGITLYTAEGRDERIQPNIINTTKTIWWVYCLYTFIGIVLLTALGMPVFDSVNHTMTAIATGGMSTRAESVGAFVSVPVYIVLMSFMILGNISFLSHYRLLTGKVKEFIRDIQNRIVFLILTVAIIAVLPFNDIMSSSFHVISAMGTGFQISGLDMWNDFSLFILIVVMILGGAAGSTAGGIKSIRVAVLSRSIYNNVKKLLLPKRIFRQGIGGAVFKDEEVYEVYRYSMLYIILFAVASVVLMATGYTVMESMFSVASAQGNVGLSIVSEFNIVSKITLMIVMIAGRLEIWSVLVLLGYIFAKRS
mgnify:CR=1 FL=1